MGVEEARTGVCGGKPERQRLDRARLRKEDKADLKRRRAGSRVLD
jgi:hypothetical protein